jgi:hypothetical protein
MSDLRKSSSRVMADLIFRRSFSIWQVPFRLSISRTERVWSMEKNEGVPIRSPDVLNLIRDYIDGRTFRLRSKEAIRQPWDWVIWWLISTARCVQFFYYRRDDIGIFPRLFRFDWVAAYHRVDTHMGYLMCSFVKNDALNGFMMGWDRMEMEDIICEWTSIYELYDLPDAFMWRLLGEVCIIGCGIANLKWPYRFSGKGE